MRRRFAFWIPVWIFWLTGLVLVVLFDRVALQQELNQYNHPVLDFFFKQITHLGGGLAVLVLLGYFAWRRRTAFWELFTGMGLGILVVAGFKFWVMPDEPRPAGIIEGLYLIPGFENDLTRSFPSGHSTAAFCMGAIGARNSRSRWAVMAWALFAILIAWSRVYLSQHFVVDILAGSFLGIIAAWFGQMLLLYFKQRQAP
jgi:membrane-associated phospholipid phosphatase